MRKSPKKCSCAAFVNEHLTEVSKARYAAGLMLEDEILAYIEDQTFKAIERKIPIPEYSRYVPPTDAEVIAYVENALNKEIHSQDVSHSETAFTVRNRCRILADGKNKIQCSKGPRLNPSNIVFTATNTPGQTTLNY